MPLKNDRLSVMEIAKSYLDNVRDVDVSKWHLSIRPKFWTLWALQYYLCKQKSAALLLGSNLNFALHSHVTCENGCQSVALPHVSKLDLALQCYMLDRVRKLQKLSPPVDGYFWNSNRKGAFLKFWKFEIFQNILDSFRCLWFFEFEF